MNRKYNFNVDIKAVVCQNMKIARKLAGIRLEDAAEIFDVTNEHLKRIEAPRDRNNMSIIMLYKASIVYQQEPNFFFRDPNENLKLLEEKEKEKESIHQ